MMILFYFGTITSGFFIHMLLVKLMSQSLTAGKRVSFQPAVPGRPPPRPAPRWAQRAHISHPLRPQTPRWVTGLLMLLFVFGTALDGDSAAEIFHVMKGSRFIVWQDFSAVFAALRACLGLFEMLCSTCGRCSLRVVLEIFGLHHVEVNNLRNTGTCGVNMSSWAVGEDGSCISNWCWLWCACYSFAFYVGWINRIACLYSTFMCLWVLYMFCTLCL